MLMLTREAGYQVSFDAGEVVGCAKGAGVEGGEGDCWVLYVEKARVARSALVRKGEGIRGYVRRCARDSSTQVQRSRL